MTVPGTELTVNDITIADAQARVEDRIKALQSHILALTEEISLLSGRVDLTMRLISRIVGHMDQSFLDDPHDPEVRRRSKLLGETVLNKMKDEAYGLAAGDPEQTNRMRRYFKDIP